MRKIPVLVLSALAPLFLASAGGAQTASLVRDINPAAEDQAASAAPRQLTVVDRKLFFIASGNNTGETLWVSDGTSTGTRMVADPCPEGCNTSLKLRGAAGDTLLFSVEKAGVVKLWRSDGTRQGTFQLGAAEDLTLERNLDIGPFAAVGKVAYFMGCTDQGCEPWRSDGTPEGTRQVRNLAPQGFSSSPQFFTPAGGRVFFIAREDHTDPVLWAVQATGALVRLRKFGSQTFVSPFTAAGNRVFFFKDFEIWTSDGTPAGTRSLRAFQRISSHLVEIRAVGNRVYFLADDGHGVELWRSDGTPDGTRRLTDFSNPQPFRDSPPDVQELGDRLVFLAQSEEAPPKLWTISGSAAPAPPVDLCGGRCGPLAGPSPLARAGGSVLFVAENSGEANQIWTTDGTPAGTRKLKDICTGASYCPAVPNFRAIAGTVVFSVWDQAFWQTDGTAEGTRRFTDADFRLQEDGHYYGQPVALGERLFFAAEVPAYGIELWTSDGRPGGTRMVTDILQGPGGSHPEHLVGIQDKLFFIACEDGDRQELWSSIGGATEAVTAGSGSTCVSTAAIEQLVPFGKYVAWWRRTPDTGAYSGELWVSDGTPEGTRGLTDHYTNFSRGEPFLEPFKGRVYYIKEGDRFDPDTENEVWSSDGTSAGTGKAFELPAEAGEPIGALATGEALFVLTDHPGQGLQVWRTTGGAGTALQRVFNNNVNLYTARYGSLGADLVFFAENGDGKVDLWRTGASGSVRVRELSWQPRNIVEYKGAIYFLSGRFDSDFGLWRSDGTEDGTVLVHKFPALGFDPGLARTYATVHAGQLFFVIDDGVHGAEIWKTDGTAAGTMLVRDLYPGPLGSSPAELISAGGKLFFSARDGVNGVELWQTDGTPGGTRLVHDLSPGGQSSFPGQFARVGDKLYFRADDGVTGWELWSIDLAGPAGCQPSPTQLCLNGGRYRVELFWRDFEGRRGRGKAVGLTADTGYFWFFDDDNVETVVKVLDGQGLNGHVWVYYGALTNIEYTLVVTDTQTGLTRHYFNPMTQFGSAGDAFGFGPLGASLKREPFQAPPSLPPAIRSSAAAASGTCQPAPTRLCLRDNRFAVEVAWTDFNGETGPGQAVGLTGDTGYFWFFNDANVELILKVLDAQAVNGRFWVYYGALSDVGYTITVTDTVTGRSTIYENPKGSFASFGDTEAF